MCLYLLFLVFMCTFVTVVDVFCFAILITSFYYLDIFYRRTLVKLDRFKSRASVPPALQYSPYFVSSQLGHAH